MDIRKQKLCSHGESTDIQKQAQFSMYVNNQLLWGITSTSMRIQYQYITVIFANIQVWRKSEAQKTKIKAFRKKAAQKSRKMITIYPIILFPRSSKLTCQAAWQSMDN